MKQQNKLPEIPNQNEVDDREHIKSESDKYDAHVNFYYTNIINSLVLFTFNAEQLDKMTPVLIDPLTELYEELQYAFTPVSFETVFRKNLIDLKFREDLLNFKSKVEEMPNEIWDWEFINENKKWKQLRTYADELLSKIGVSSRTYNDEFTTIILNTGEIIKSGKKS
ncbi:hypothetical protein F0919_03355 [Taibaiella lutea]|uniref:Uncharacterized protein n=1 Tax=Taibaiella lutea TaxID=2608001 RepID=A0A5M6CQP5_9BACT|nr:hypothetical protein [Taibaiella lutea]KAA5536720.1 hypothetical protein F0919_03355 [Taibaiella lutea]